MREPVVEADGSPSEPVRAAPAGEPLAPQEDGAVHRHPRGETARYAQHQLDLIEDGTDDGSSAWADTRDR